MDIQAIRKEREAWMGWKNIAPLRKMLEDLPNLATTMVFNDAFTLNSELPLEQKAKQTIYDTAWAMRPWRKGPFEICETYIDSEWKSNQKFDLIKDAVDLEGKIVADIGCNNGYYMFKMLEQAPKKVVGFDPSALNKTQFDFINHFAKTDIAFELLGVEHFEYYEHTFDVAFCLGVIYHRSDPIGMLKSIRKGLNTGGVLILDTFMIDEDADIALTPKERYAKIPNIYFIPTIRALTNWCERAGFKDVEVLAVTVTTENEQRKTNWIIGESLGSFLDPDDSSKTVEGYDAPKRLYIKAYKK